jgi:hypothetical protein
LVCYRIYIGYGFKLAKFVFKFLKGVMIFFFVGGADQAQKPIGVYNNVICPSCGMLTRYEISKTYSYFHLFFIPTFRWNVRYLVTTGCCGNLYELDPEIGRKFERKQNPEIRNEHLRPLSQYVSFKSCSGCRAKVDTGYSFCPYCGQKL